MGDEVSPGVDEWRSVWDDEDGIGCGCRCGSVAWWTCLRRGWLWNDGGYGQRVVENPGDDLIVDDGGGSESDGGGSWSGRKGAEVGKGMAPGRVGHRHLETSKNAW